MFLSYVAFLLLLQYSAPFTVKQYHLSDVIVFTHTHSYNAPFHHNSWWLEGAHSGTEEEDKLLCCVQVMKEC